MNSQEKIRELVWFFLKLCKVMSVVVKQLVILQVVLHEVCDVLELQTAVLLYPLDSLLHKMTPIDSLNTPVVSVWDLATFPHPSENQI